MLAWTPIVVDAEGGVTFRRWPEIGLGRDLAERVLNAASESEASVAA